MTHNIRQVSSVSEQSYYISLIHHSPTLIPHPFSPNFASALTKKTEVSRELNFYLLLNSIISTRAHILCSQDYVMDVRTMPLCKAASQ